MKFYKKKAIILFLPGLMGFLTFYIVPMGVSFYYTLVNNAFEKQFIGFDNYIRVFNNHYFKLALKNTFVFSGVGVPILILFSLLIVALFLYLDKGSSALRIPFLLPILLPTAGIVLIWQILFGENSLIYQYVVPNAQVAFDGNRLPIYVLLIWKNSGYNIILFMAAVSGIPKEYYEAASLDGCGLVRRHFSITLPMILPTVFFVFILSIVNSFRLFREIYLYYGTNYPPDSVYVLQYYMNNNFNKLNYQDLATGTIIFAAMVCVLIFALYKVEKRFYIE